MDGEILPVIEKSIFLDLLNEDGWDDMVPGRSSTEPIFHKAAYLKIMEPRNMS